MLCAVFSSLPPYHTLRLCRLLSAWRGGGAGLRSLPPPPCPFVSLLPPSTPPPSPPFPPLPGPWRPSRSTPPTTSTSRLWCIPWPPTKCFKSDAAGGTPWWSRDVGQSPTFQVQADGTCFAIEHVTIEERACTCFVFGALYFGGALHPYSTQD